VGAIAESHHAMSEARDANLLCLAAAADTERSVTPNLKGSRR
jgi:hypothetical protein